MARSQARIMVSIWNDPDFLALPSGPQRLYMFLLSQANLNHAGLLPLTVKRWARAAPDLTVESITADLAYLADRRYVVIDEETEELLVRTLVKGDGIWKQPKVMPAMAADATEISSSRLRFALRQELLSIDLSGLKSETRAVVEPVMERVIDTLPHTLPDTVSTAEIQPQERVSDTTTRDARAASASTSTTTPATTTLAPPRKKRDPDPIWDALLEACGIDEVTESARGAYNKAAGDLRGLNADPSEIRRRAAIYRGQWPIASLTPTALVRRWGECTRPNATGPPKSRNGQVLDAAMLRAEAAEAAMSGERKALG